MDRGVMRRVRALLSCTVAMAVLVPGGLAAAEDKSLLEVAGEGFGLVRVLQLAGKSDSALLAGRYAEAIGYLEELESVASGMDTDLGNEIARQIPLSRAGIYAGMAMAEETQAALADFRKAAGKDITNEERSAALRIQAVLAANRGNLRVARSFLLRARRILPEDASSLAGLSLVCLQMQVLLNLGEYDKGVEVYEAYEVPADLGAKARAYVGVLGAALLAPAGRTDEAVALLNAQLKPLERRKWYVLASEAHWMLGTIYMTQGSHDLAAEHLQLAASAASKGDSPASSTVAFIAEIRLLWDRQDHEAALDRLDAWRKEQRRWGQLERSYRVDADSYQAMILVEMGRWQDVVDCVENFKAHPDWTPRGEAYTSLLSAGVRGAVELGDQERAGTWAEELARRVAEMRPWSENGVRCFTNLGLAAELGGRPAEAEGWYDRALQEADACRDSALGSHEERARVSRRYTHVVDRLVALRMERGAYLEAVAAMERGRARSVADMMLGGEDPEPPLDAAGRRDLRVLTAEVEGIHEAIERLTMVDSQVQVARGVTLSDGGSGGGAADPSIRSELEDLGAKLEDKVRERDQLLARARQESAETGETELAATPLDAQGLSALPADGELLVTWHLAPDAAWVVAWTRDSASGASLDASAGEITRSVDHVRALLDPRSPGDGERTRTALAATWTMLLAPVEVDVEAAGQLVLLPHAALHGLPFSALIDRDGDFLGVEHGIARAPTATVLGMLRRRCSEVCALTPALLVGNPTGDLAASAREVEAVTGMLEAHASSGGAPCVGITTLLEDEADEARVTAGIRDARTVLLSTHGVYWPGAPTESHLRLAASPATDGRWTVAEIAGQTIGAELVFLSGCSTGRAGEMTGDAPGHARQGSAGDDVLGISVAFQVAGAQRVVATLWDVADTSSGLFVVDVFGRLIDGIPLGEALRQSREAMIEGAFPVGHGADTTHPAFWAPFVLIGPSR